MYEFLLENHCKCEHVCSCMHIQYISRVCTGMDWFAGGVVDAISACRRDKCLFLVYVHGK